MSTTVLPPSALPGSPSGPQPPRRPRGGRTTKGSARLIRVVAGLVALGLVLTTMASLVGQMVRKEHSERHPLTAGITSVSIEAAKGSVRVRAADPGEEPYVSEHSVWGLRRPAVSVERPSTSEAHLSSRCDGFVASDPCHTEWEVVVPAETELSIVTDAGEVDVAGIAGDTKVRTSVGEVRVTDSHAGVIDVAADVGTVEVTATGPLHELHASSDIGEVTARVPRGEYDVTVTSDVGTATNGVPDTPGAERTIRLRSSVGDVRLSHSD